MLKNIIFVFVILLIASSVAGKGFKVKKRTVAGVATVAGYQFLTKDDITKNLCKKRGNEEDSFVCSSSVYTFLRNSEKKLERERNILENETKLIEKRGREINLYSSLEVNKFNSSLTVIDKKIKRFQKKIDLHNNKLSTDCETIKQVCLYKYSGNYDSEPLDYWIVILITILGFWYIRGFEFLKWVYNKILRK